MKNSTNNIKVSPKEDYFRIDTQNTSYVIGIEDGLYLGHFYYGPSISDDSLSYRRQFSPWMTPTKNKRELAIFMDGFSFEYPGWGRGDTREGALKAVFPDGTERVDLIYQGYEISSGKALVPGLPATFDTEGEVETLRIDLKDPDTGLSVALYYSAFAACDVIARRVEVVNGGDSDVILQRVLSASMDMPGRDRQGRPYELMTFHGTWAREFTREIRPIGFGRTGVTSINGKSGNRTQSFLGIVSPGITQEDGEVYGLQFLYSGNYSSMVEKVPSEDLRVSMGIHPEEFNWTLAPGEVFYAPEVVMTYSSCGLGKMSRNFHDLFRKHLIRGAYRDKKRPILINNWEATYFDFNTDKLLAIAKQAKECGVEMLVVDDGWFGKRNDDSTSLGDWTVNEEKLPGGLSGLSGKLKEMGMKLGVWFEPEMVSPDSDLYRAHPDWAISIPQRDITLSRNQLVLDVSRKDVRDYLISAISAILESADVSYVKWDMNRHMADLYSAELPAERQGELLHRYVLGLYDLQERLLTKFPHILLENCSSGGARFDPGMLYYSPQIWTSDDTDAYERIRIQEGAATLYPLSALGAHVSICPNHVTGRTVPITTRGHVALAGTFGYELDITQLSKEDHEEMKKQTALFHKYNDLIRKGDYYRIASFRDNGFYDCYGVVSKDKSEMLLTLIHVMNRPCNQDRLIFLKGLDEKKRYRVTWAEDPEDQPEVIVEAYGSTLMNAGLIFPCLNGDFRSVLYYILEI